LNRAPVIGIVLPRGNHFRLLFPIVEGALRRGLRVIVYHLYWGDRFGMGKALEFPVMSSSQGYEFAGAESRLIPNADSLRTALRADAVDWVFSIQWASNFKLDLAEENYRWGVLQVGIDLFTFPVTETDMRRSQLFVRSKYWLENAIPAAQSPLYREHAVHLRETCVETGYLAVQDATRFDPEKIARKYGLDPKRRYLLFLPFQSGGLETRVQRRIDRWYLRHFFDRRDCPPQPWEASLLRRLRLQPKSMYDMWQDVRRLADRLGLIPLVKGRFKGPLQSYFPCEAAAFYDESYAPSTTHELLRLSDVCVSHYSMVNFEAVHLGAFSLNLSWPTDLIADEMIYKALFGANYDAIWRWTGVTSVITDSDSLRTLPERDLKLDAEAAARFVQRYDAGIQDGIECVFRAMEPSVSRLSR